MTTAAEANDLWCPMTRIARVEVLEHRSSSDFAIVAGCNRDALGGKKESGGGNVAPHGPNHNPLNSCRCVADKCAMWRWTPSGEHGYCGLAGRPEAFV